MAIITDFDAQDRIDKDINAEIKRHLECMKVLKMRRNSHCAMNKLPVDVLIDILLLTTPGNWFSHGFFITRLALLHICHSWNALIMNEPRFWSTIDLDRPQASRKLSLSKAAPLQITFGLSSFSLSSLSAVSERLWPLVREIISQSNRLHYLSMTFDTFDAISHAFSMIPPTNSAPHLRELRIRVESIKGKPRRSYWTDLPSLHSLTLINGPLPSNAHSMPHLTHLSITCTHPCSVQPSVPWLLELFQSSKGVQNVCIDKLYGPPVHPGTPLVSLPSLQILSLRSNDLSTLTILEYMDAPSLTSFEMIYGDAAPNPIEATEATDLSSLQSTMLRILETSKSIHLVNITYTDNFNFAVYLQENQDRRDGNSHSIMCVFPLAVQVDMPIFLQLLELRTVRRASTLVIDRNSTIHLGRIPFIASFSHIKTLVIANCNVRVLSSLLKSPTTARPPYPRLECLRLEFIDYQRRYTIQRLLIDIVSERKQHKIPLKKLMVYGCWIQDCVIRQLSRFVEVVDGKWDEDEDEDD